MSRAPHRFRHWLVEYKDEVLGGEIPRTRYVRVCDGSEPEPTDGSIHVVGLDRRYRHLLRALPLGGAAAMHQRPDGQLALTARLLDAAPWLEQPIQLIDRQLRFQLWAGRPWIWFKPMLLVGPPGCGKSHLARLIAEQCGAGHASLDFAGTSDNRTLEGTARGWTNAQPCFPAITINRTRSANPIIAIEELDKAGGSRRHGNPLATLLTMIERSTAAVFFDKCLMAPVDLSHVNWIMTANSAHALPAPLRSRLTILEVTGPGPEHFEQLLANLVRSLAAQLELAQAMLPTLEPEVVALLRSRFLRHRSVRRTAADLEAVVAAVIRSAPRRLH